MAFKIGYFTPTLPLPPWRLRHNSFFVVVAGPPAAGLAYVIFIDFIEPKRNLKVATTNYDTASKGGGKLLRN